MTNLRTHASFHAKIKSPIELVIGTLKTLAGGPSLIDLPYDWSRRREQNLFEPPSVKGWDGGLHAGINTGTLMERFNFATRITQQKFDAVEELYKTYRAGEKPGTMTDSRLDRSIISSRCWSTMMLPDSSRQ